MAVNLLSRREVSELCLGKPPLRPLSLHLTVADALAALKRLGDSSLSVWSCHCPSSSSSSAPGDCRCVGKISVADVVCFLARPENLSSPATALQAPLADLIPKSSGLVRHLESNASLVEAIDMMLEGAQNLVIPIQTRKNTKASSFSHNNNKHYCWITREDIIRHLFNSIGLFGPTLASPVAALPGLVEAAPGRLLSLAHHEPAPTLIALAVATQTSVAVLDDQGRLIGEISPFTLNCSDETVAAAVATLSAGDLMAYIDNGGPPEDLVQVVKDRLEERGCGWFFDLTEEEGCLSTMSSSSSLCSSSSSDEELGRSGGRLGGARRCEPMVCHAGSSMVAVMIQALVHRSGCVWVVGEDGVLHGVVTFAGMLKVFRERLSSM